jgi:DNA repair exonuclease SbcCD nuclease subunit
LVLRENAMLILHTSDLHLSEDKPKTIAALDELLRLANERSVDLMTIGGDLFDSAEDAEALRSELRRKFSNNGFDILSIPGNHDIEAYALNLDFGSDLTIVTEKPFKVISKDNVSIVALPFTERPFEELLSGLRRAVERTKASILLLHCTLDIGFSAGDLGEGEALDYFPISTATLGRLGYDWVLSGHFHKTTNIRKLGDKGWFVYPGSPVSHTRKETGRRNTVLIDTSAETCQPIPLKCFYYDSFTVNVRPRTEDEAIQSIEKWITQRRGDDCALEVIVDGFIEKDEKEFRNSIEGIAEGVELDYRCRNITDVLEHPLFQRFKKKLADSGAERKEEIEAKVIDAMARLLRTRELRA